MTDESPAWPHGEIVPFLDELYFVEGTNRTTHEGVAIQTSRTMLVVRTGADLALVSTVRLDEDGLSALDALGRVRHVLRIGAFHGRDDAFYCRRYGASLSTVAPTDAAHRAIVDGGALPIDGARALVFSSARFPEAALFLPRGGGVLVTCDAVQNWSRTDRFFSPETGAAFERAGLVRRANVPSTWIGACAPERRDYDRLLALPFRHLVTAHGEPLLDVAHEALVASVDRAFPVATPG